MKLKPLGKNVIVSVIDGGKLTDSGILLSVSLNPDRGLVHAVGPEAKEVSVGDQVFLDWNKAVKIEGGDNYLISEDNIIWIYEE